MSPNTFPRVTIPGIEVTDDQREFMAQVNKDYSAWRSMKARYALALMQSGQQPYVSPGPVEVAKRRKAGKAQRIARRANRAG